MAPTFDRLAAMIDDDLRAAYDAAAGNTVTGTAFYLDELNRRAFARAGQSAHQLARVSAVMACVAVIVAVVAIIVPLLAQSPEVQPCMVVVGHETRIAQCLTSP